MDERQVGGIVLQNGSPLRSDGASSGDDPESGPQTVRGLKVAVSFRTGGAQLANLGFTRSKRLVRPTQPSLLPQASLSMLGMAVAIPAGAAKVMTETKTQPAIRIMTVDDHPVLRDGLFAIIEMQPDMTVVGEAEGGIAAVGKFRQLRPDITLMDLQMPEGSGLDAIKAIRAEAPNAKIIVLTTYAGDVQALSAIKAGASGYLLKSTLRRELLDAIRKVHAGRRHLPHEIATDIAMHAGDETLSEREIEVLRLVAGGDANKQIAWRLTVTEDTVKAHLKSIFSKLGVGDRTHAVTVAAKRGIIEL